MTTGTLSAVAVKNAKAKEQPYKLSDGGGMFLLVDAKGGKYWRLAYRFLGKQKTLALGVYPEVSLELAEELGTKPGSSCAKVPTPEWFARWASC